MKVSIPVIAVDEVIIYPCYSCVQDQAAVDLQDKHAVSVLGRGDELITVTTSEGEAARENELNKCGIQPLTILWQIKQEN